MYIPIVTMKTKFVSPGSNRYHFKISIYTMSLRHGGEVPQTQKSKIPSAENPKAVKAFFFVPGLGQKRNMWF